MYSYALVLVVPCVDLTLKKIISQEVFLSERRYLSLSRMCDCEKLTLGVSRSDTCVHACLALDIRCKITWDTHTGLYIITCFILSILPFFLWVCK